MNAENIYIYTYVARAEKIKNSKALEIDDIPNRVLKEAMTLEPSLFVCKNLQRVFKRRGIPRLVEGTAIGSSWS